jgi:hypothetical protein
MYPRPAGRDSRGDQLAVQIDQLIVRAADGHATLTYQVPRRGYTHPSQVSARPSKTPRETALHIITTILNANLDGVSRQLIVEIKDDRRPGLTSLFEPLALIDSVWWLLADAVVKGKVRECLECGAFFVATDDRMRFCPLPRGQEGSGSRCLSRAKQREYRVRKAQQIAARAGKGGAKQRQQSRQRTTKAHKAPQRTTGRRS